MRAAWTPVCRQDEPKIGGAICQAFRTPWPLCLPPDGLSLDLDAGTGGMGEAGLAGFYFLPRKSLSAQR